MYEKYVLRSFKIQCKIKYEDLPERYPGMVITSPEYLSGLQDKKSSIYLPPRKLRNHKTKSLPSLLESSPSHPVFVKPGTMASYQEPIKKKRVNPIQSILRSNSPINTGDMIDDTFAAFLPEFCQRHQLKYEDRDPLDYCLDINLVLPDLDTDQILFSSNMQW